MQKTFKPLVVQAPWTCDACGDPIETIEGGWVDWVQTPLPPGGDIPQYKSHLVSVVHHKSHSPRRGGCYHNRDEWFRRDKSLTAGVHLDWYLGPDGLMRLLDHATDPRFDSQEISEVIKRLHIPGYEQARLSFDAAIGDGAFDPNTRPGFYKQEDIVATLKWLHRQTSDEEGR